MTPEQYLLKMHLPRRVGVAEANCAAEAKQSTGIIQPF
jgi:hypothetical protein